MTLHMALRNLLTKRVLLFLILGLTVFSLYLYFYVGTVNVAEELGRANLAYYVAAFVAFLAAIFFSCLAWSGLLRNLSIKVGIKRVILYMWVGLFFDATVPEPGWSGDLSKAYMLAKSSKQDPGKIVATVVGQKIIIMIITVVDLALGIGLLATTYNLPIASTAVLGFLALILFITIFALFVVVYLSAKPKATKRMLNWLIQAASFLRRNRWDPTEFRSNTEKTLERFHEGMGTLAAEKGALIRPVAFSFASWGFDVGVVMLVFASLGYPIPVDKVLIVYAVTGTLQSIGVSFVGFTELIMSTAYSLLSIPIPLSFSVTLLTRVVTLWFKLLVSYVAFQYAGIKMLLSKDTPKDHEKEPGMGNHPLQEQAISTRRDLCGSSLRD
jgi:uncharacterized protein (TIRG00374 family)